MKRIQGSLGVKALECANPRLQKWIVRWDFQPTLEDNGEQVGVNYFEKWVTHKPSMDEIKETVLGGYNQVIDQKILSGFVWKDMEVWLSSENQFNYKAAYDLAVMSQGKSLPSTFKFGTTENPVYYTFSTLDDISDFYLSAMAYINGCLTEGWKQKDSIDWSVYEEALKE